MRNDINDLEKEIEDTNIDIEKIQNEIKIIEEKSEKN